MIKHCNTSVLLIPLLMLLFVACADDNEKNTKTDIPTVAIDATSDSHASAPQSADALCIAHGVAASQCFICDAALREPGRLWCAEHARYEDRCFVCHPEIRQANRLFCDEHGLYEDECFLCHPELKL